MKIVMQEGIKDCGICSLLSVIRYYGGDVSREYLREITNTTKNGVSAYSLVQAANRLGFMAEGVSGDMNKIEDNNLPCLAHLSLSKGYKHFVVIYEIDRTKQKVIIMDPAKGRRKLTFAEFKLLSTGNYIFLAPTKKIPCITKRKVIKRLVKEVLRKNKRLVILLVIIISHYFILSILVTFHLKYLLEFVINYDVVTNLKIVSIILFFLYALKCLCGVIKNLLVIKISSFLDNELTNKTFKQILLLPYLYYKNRTTGEVITRLKDLATVKNFVISLISFLAVDCPSLILFFLLMVNLSKKITIIIGVIGLFMILFFTVANKKKRKLYVKVCRKEDRLNSYLVEALSSVDTIKGGHIEKRLADKFLLLYKNLLAKNYSYMEFLEIGNVVVEVAEDLILFVVYGYGTYLVLKRVIDIADIFLYQSFLTYFLNSVKALIKEFDQYCNYRVSLERIEDIYAINSENFAGSYYYYGYQLDGDIVFNNLTYKYGIKTILAGITMTIKSGEKILLIGESGSGKSSLVKILMRYLDVPYGMCSINNIDINHYHLENIRKNISYVSSDEFIFTDTLYNNITLEKDVEEEEFFEVCHITRVDEIIKKRGNDYHIMVEENGFNFSNGERQRIILARYLMRKSNIYIFDEALGQLDTSKEKEILKDMFYYLKEKTVIVISHRTNNSKLFTRTLKLENGQIYETKI